MIGLPLVSAHTHSASSTLICRCPTRGETVRAPGPNTGTRCRFSAQYLIIATPRNASGSASGGSMTIFAGGSPVSGITPAGRHLSLAFCANEVIAHKNMTAIDSSGTPFDLTRFRIFILVVIALLIDSQIRCHADNVIAEEY